MTDTVELEVRCCCTPTRLYGYLSVPEHMARRGYGINIAAPVPGQLGDYVPRRILTVDTITDLGKPTPVLPTTWELLQRACTTRLAFKFEGDDMTPAEKLALLRRVPGFREATPCP